ncbi:MAG TPA: PEPxxWA-CTERM sorting domain-containing protein [Caulobacteraceae bacterium]|jgi:hypothetical protein
MKLRVALASTAVTVALGLTAGAAQAGPSNLPPPAGAILDLNGSTITNDQQQYAVNFSAGVANTAITFAFRQDPSFESFSGVSVVDLTNPGGNLILNGDFSNATLGTSSAADWTYANVYGADAGGIVASGCGVGGSNCWFDGAVQAYDAISQTIATTVGDTYQISFNLNGGVPDGGIYSSLSTSGDVTGSDGNGIDVLAYAQAGLPPAGGVPEPATWAMALVGVGMIGGSLRTVRRKSAMALAAL